MPLAECMAALTASTTSGFRLLPAAGAAADARRRRAGGGGGGGGGGASRGRRNGGAADGGDGGDEDLLVCYGCYAAVALADCRAVHTLRLTLAGVLAERHWQVCVCVGGGCADRRGWGAAVLWREYVCVCGGGLTSRVAICQA